MIILRGANLHELSKNSKLMTGKTSIYADKKQRYYQPKKLPNNLSKNRKLIHGFPSVAICNDYNVIKRAKKGI